MKVVLKKIATVLLVSVMALGCVACNNLGAENVTAIEVLNDVSVNLWYTDDSMTPYMDFAASKYNELNSQVKVVPQLVLADDYLENIYNGSIKEDNTADLYMLSSDYLEKAYLMGLTSENDKFASVYTENVYGKAGIESAKYNDKILGYPLSFDTSVMVYNKKYAKTMNTFEDITAFNNEFKHTEENTEVKVIIQWDASDVYTNYAFVGANMNIGGESGDDKSKIEVNSTKLKESLAGFLKCKTDYGIIRKTTTLADCIKLFSQNQLLYTIVSSDNLRTFNETGVDYGIIRIPDISNTLKSNTLSSTDLMMVNPYSDNLAVAKSVAKAFTYDYAENLYEQTGMASARGDLTNNPSEEYTNLHQIYSDSIVKAQFMKIGDFYVKLEIMLHQVWDGTSIEESMNTFDSYVNVIKGVTTTTASTVAK